MLYLFAFIEKNGQQDLPKVLLSNTIVNVFQIYNPHLNLRFTIFVNAEEDECSQIGIRFTRRLRRLK